MPNCDHIAREVEQLKRSREPFQNQLSGVAGNARAALLRRIKAINEQIGVKQAEYDRCVGADRVQGAIRDKWYRLGGARGVLGHPLTDEMSTPDNVGRFNHFNHGSIYWHPDLGAWEVHGAIREKWATLGWERSVLGYPTSDERQCLDGEGRFSRFQHGLIYWHPDTGAFEVHGAIRHRWELLGWLTASLAKPERSFLGYPITDETTTPDNEGRFNHFQGGSIYWHPRVGAWEVHGSIRDKWSALGWERSLLGYPVSNEHQTPDGGGRFSHFERGSIYWHPNVGAFEVHGDIRERWVQLGAEQGHLGYPTTDEHDLGPAGGRRSLFQNGSISLTAAGLLHVDPIVLKRQWFDGGIDDRIGGWVELRLHSDGNVVFSGHTRGSSFQGFDYRIAVLVRSPHAPLGIMAAHEGSVEGGLTGGFNVQRDDDWTDDPTFNPGVRANFPALQAASMEYNEWHRGAITGPLEDIAEFAVKWLVGGLVIATPGAAMLLFVGTELVSLAATGSLVPGARIAEGFLWGTGPFGSLIAIPAQVAGWVGENRREVPQDAYDRAQRLFGNTLPPRDRILLSDVLGGGGDAFTWPTFDGKIVLHVGKATYNDPLGDGPTKPNASLVSTCARLFVHELVHAWQLHNGDSNTFWMLDGTVTQLCDAFSNQYNYNDSELGAKAWGDFNLEQQGSIVDDWFFRQYFPDTTHSRPHGFAAWAKWADTAWGTRHDPWQHLDDPAATGDRAFSYIALNVRAGSV